MGNQTRTKKSSQFLSTATIRLLLTCVRSGAPGAGREHPGGGGIAERSSTSNRELVKSLPRKKKTEAEIQGVLRRWLNL